MSEKMNYHKKTKKQKWDELNEMCLYNNGSPHISFSSYQRTKWDAHENMIL